MNLLACTALTRSRMSAYRGVTRRCAWLHYLLLVLILGASPFGTALAALTTSFNPAPDGNVTATAQQADGKLLVAGDFSSIDGQASPRLVRLSRDGTLDPGFTAAIAAGAEVKAIGVQPDGAIVVAGSAFASGNSVERFNADGTLDTSFTPQLADKPIQSLLLLADGKMLVAGRFSQIGGVARTDIARLNADGSVDTSFDAGLDANGSGNLRGIVTMAALPSGKVLVGGAFSDAQGEARQVARLDADGMLDTTFNDPGFNGLVVYTLAVAANQDIVLGGQFAGQAGYSFLARLTPDGSLDPSFAATTDNVVRSVVIQPDGDIVLGGDFSKVNGQNQPHLARLHADGSDDATFAPSVDDEVDQLLVQNDGSIVIGGAMSQVNGQSRPHLARLLANGSLSAFSLPVTTDGWVAAMAVEPDGGTLIGGDFTHVDGAEHEHIARLNPDGSLDPSFNESATYPTDPGTKNPAVVNTIVVQPDGKILVGGFFNRFDNEDHGSVVRLLANGGVDTSFSAAVLGLTSHVASIALQDNGKMLVAGHLEGNATNLGVVRLDADGTLDTTFTQAFDDADIINLAVQNDGRILVAGKFGGKSGGYEGMPGVKRLYPDGLLDPGFSPSVDTNDPTLVTALQPDGNILMGGRLDLQSSTGQQLGNLVRLTSTGARDLGFNPNVAGSVHGELLQADGKILLNGNFTTVGGQARQDFARVNADGSLDTSVLDAGLVGGSVDEVDAMAMIHAGHVVLAKYNVGSSSIEHFSLPDTLRQSVSINAARDTLTWTREGAGPQLVGVHFWISTQPNDASSWTDLGRAVRVPNGWRLGGLSATQLPHNQDFWIRADGSARTGMINNSVSRYTRVRMFHLSDFRVTAQVASGAGSIGPALQQFGYPGGDATLVVSPAEGSQVDTVSGDTCTPIDNGDGSWTAYNITADCAVTATFKESAITVVAGVGTGQGSITPLSQSIGRHSSAAFTVTPAPGYTIDSVDGDTCTPTSQGSGEWIASNVQADCAVTANFAAASFSVSATSVGGHGGIDPANQSVAYDGKATFTLAPDAGWSVASVHGDTCTPLQTGPATWVAQHVDVDCAVQARFTPAVQMTLAAGAGQHTPVGADFAQALSVRVSDAQGQPMPGETVVFAAPGSGASAFLAAAGAVTNGQGVAEVSARANLKVGSYVVQASLPSHATTPPVGFDLSNTQGQSALVASIDDQLDYASYGQMLNYRVRVANNGPSPVNDVSVQATLSAALDLSHAQWLCLTPESGCNAQGQGPLDASGLSLEPGSEAVWLLSVPTRVDATAGKASADLSVVGGSSNIAAHDDTQLVIFRNGFEGETGSTATTAAAAAFATPQSGQLLDMPAAKQVPGNGLTTQWHSKDGAIQVQCLTYNNARWLRLVLGGKGEAARASAWMYWRGATPILARDVDEHGTHWLVLDAGDGSVRLALD